MAELVLKVAGMTCGGCARSVGEVLQKTPGVHEAVVSLENAQATVRYDPAVVSVAQLQQAISDAGFESQS